MVLKQLKGGLISLNEAREATEWSTIDGDAANNIFMPAHLLSQSPVSYNNFDEDLARTIDLQGGGKSDPLPAGNAGGDDNTNVVTDSRGGPQKD
jgi:hypothetical protein